MALPALASGAVLTGYSYPVVSRYVNTNGTISHADGMDLARGVSVSPSIETLGEDNTFYANNAAAEEAQQRFRRGTATFTVDGLLVAAERLLLGLPAAVQETVGTGTVSMIHYGDSQSIPYVTVGFVTQWQSAGTIFYRAHVYTKTRFSQFAVSAETQGEEVDWQTTELEARLMRDDSANHDWQIVSEPLETELEAYNAIRVLNGLQTVTALPGNGPVSA